MTTVAGATSSASAGALTDERKPSIAVVDDDSGFAGYLRTFLALRGYDRDGMLLAAEIVDGREVETGIDSVFSDPAVAYIHAHFAKPGCYAALIERAT